jgi:hypothetical protein
MSFGKLGAMGRGFGHLGNLGTAGRPAIFNYVTNIQALIPMVQALKLATAQPVYMNAAGDSITCFGGDSSNPTSDQLAEQYGWLARVRARLNTYFGTPDGGQFLPAQASVADTRVAISGGGALNNFMPFEGYNDGAGSPVNRWAWNIQGAGTLTYTITGRYLDVLIWENAPNSYNGTFSYQIDGGSTVNQSTNTGLTDTFRQITIDMGSNAAHTAVLRWVSGNVLIASATVRYGTGVATRRLALGAQTAKVFSSLSEKSFRTTFKTLPSHVYFIRFSYNDWNTQGASGTTPTLFATYVQSLIDAATLAPNNVGIILLADPPSATADNKTYSKQAYIDQLTALALANTNVSFIDMHAMSPWTTFVYGDSQGYYVDNVIHLTASGYDFEAQIIVNQVLLSPWLLRQT